MTQSSPNMIVQRRFPSMDYKRKFFHQINISNLLEDDQKLWFLSSQMNDSSFVISGRCWAFQFEKAINWFADCRSNCALGTNLQNKAFRCNNSWFSGRIFVVEPTISKRERRIWVIIIINFEGSDFFDLVRAQWNNWYVLVGWMTFLLADDTFQFLMEEI